MEALKTIVNRLKTDFAEKIEFDLIDTNYGIKSCLNSIFDKFNYKKLEILFLSNLDYLDLNQNQLPRAR